MTPPSGQHNWDRIAEMDEFRRLLRARNRFVVPACAFFVVYYFALPVLVGYAPGFMETKILGPVNLAYLFALSQFFMAWTIAWLYVRAARRFDHYARQIAERLNLDHRGDSA